MVGRLISFWETPFSGAMLVSGSVNETCNMFLEFQPSIFSVASSSSRLTKTCASLNKSLLGHKPRWSKYLSPNKNQEWWTHSSPVQPLMSISCEYQWRFLDLPLFSELDQILLVQAWLHLFQWSNLFCPRLIPMLWQVALTSFVNWNWKTWRQKLPEF